MAIHYFQIDELKALADADYLIQCAQDNNNDALTVREVLEHNRQLAEDYVKSRVAVRYDVTEWDVDVDEDEISDNIDGVLKLCAMQICRYYIASRRPDQIPQNIIDGYNEAKQVLEWIASGQMVLSSTSEAIQRSMYGNMTEDDLGELTEDGDPLPWSGYQ